MKDIEWLKEQVKGEYEYNRKKHNKEGFEGYAHREFVFKYVLGLLDQLDEPEVLSQELPVIPKFVAEWIEKYIEYGYDLYLALKKMENNSRSWKKTYDWYRKNTHTFVNAYLTGKYEVEEEQKYEVRCKGELLLTYYTNIGEVVSMNRWHNHLSKKAGRDWKLRHQLTEQEIKDYDERYWEFAKPVEELEE